MKILDRRRKLLKVPVPKRQGWDPDLLVSAFWEASQRQNSRVIE